ncbi:hypothetical protein L7F22_040966 [Adiantum nelumboides]|nr:hypothetical protein [Adiantum nelumboides]
MRGPWDGLGVNRWDMGSCEKDQQGDEGVSIQNQPSNSTIDTKKRLAPSSVQSVVSRRLKIVGVKANNEAQKPAQCTGSSLKLLETSNTLQWQGLVGYGSDDSDNDGPGGTPG